MAARLAAIGADVPFSPVSLTHLTTMGVAATADRLVSFKSHSVLDGYEQPTCILGGGSNTLFVEHFQGSVLHPVGSDIQYAESSRHWLIEADAGVEWHQLVIDSLARGYSGLENLALIPGCVGAAPVQNIGAYGVQFADVCDYVSGIDLDSGEPFRLDAKRCQFDYRHSIFKSEQAKRWIVTKVGMRLPKQWQPNVDYGPLRLLSEKEGLTAQQVCEQVIHIRQAKLPDPAKTGNVGSFFKNPYVKSRKHDELLQQFPNLVSFQEGKRWKLAAGWLIDRLGWKGRNYGDAAVHAEQALVLVNRGNATARDVVGLAWQLRQQVVAEYGVMLEPEVCLIGAEGPITLEQAYEITHL